MKKLRWGVIGAGGIADRRTIPGMMLAENAELIAVMDINAEQVEKIRQKYGAKRGYTKEEDLLADPEVDAVYIATPIVLHAKQAKLAADYGKDILIEKPLAMTSDEGQAVIDYCERKGVKIAAGFMMRFGSHVMSMKKAIAEGKIGKIAAVNAEYVQEWLIDELGVPGEGTTKLSVWRADPAVSGISNCVGDIGTHIENSVHYLTDLNIKRLAATVNRYGKELDLKTDLPLLTSTVIPYRGAWLEYETDTNEVFWVRIDKNRKIPITELVRAIGFKTDAEILELFGDDDRVAVTLEGAASDYDLIAG